MPRCSAARRPRCTSRRSAGLDPLDEDRLRAALTARVRRRVRRDATVPLDGVDCELDQGFPAGRLVTVARCLVDLSEPPWVEHEGHRRVLHPVDPTRNAHRARGPRPDRTTVNTVAFDPPRALLEPRGPPRPPPRGGRRMTAWLTHFGLQQAPFSKELEDAALWLPPSRSKHSSTP